jgi:hypothetical protein
MRSVADTLRDRTSEAVMRLAVPDRIALALALGDADLDLYVSASGLTRGEALARLRAQRARGRTISSWSADLAR